MKILIIEDDVYILDIYKQVLEKGGFTVETATNGPDGLAKSESDNFNMILLDIMLPGLDGISLLKKIKEPNAKNSNTPVFMLTNLGQDNIITDAFAAGASGYMIKAQIKPQNILSEITSFLEKSS